MRATTHPPETGGFRSAASAPCSSAAATGSGRKDPNPTASDLPMPLRTLGSLVALTKRATTRTSPKPPPRLPQPVASHHLARPHHHALPCSPQQPPTATHAIARLPEAGATKSAGGRGSPPRSSSLTIHAHLLCHPSQIRADATELSKSTA